VGRSPLSMTVEATPPHRVQPERMWVSRYVQLQQNVQRPEFLLYCVVEILTVSKGAARVPVWSPSASSSSHCPSSWPPLPCHHRLLPPHPPQSCCNLWAVQASWLLSLVAAG